jgi:hypothetical protein
MDAAIQIKPGRRVNGIIIQSWRAGGIDTLNGMRLETPATTAAETLFTTLLEG